MLVLIALSNVTLTAFSLRQGVLPYPRFWASTRPFGTTLGPYLVKYILTIIMIVAPPAGDAFNFSKGAKYIVIATPKN